MGTVQVDDFESLHATGTVADSTLISEAGLMVSANADLSEASYFPADSVSKNYEVKVTDLEELTDYYVCAYVVNKNGSILHGEPQKVTTPKAPEFSIAGKYLCTNFVFSPYTEEFLPADDESMAEMGMSATYDLTINFVEGSDTEVEITNLWDGGMTIEGEWDPEAKTVTIFDRQQIADHPAYGEIIFLGITDEVDNYQDYLYITMDKKGNISSSNYMPYDTEAWGTFRFDGKRYKE